MTVLSDAVFEMAASARIAACAAGWTQSDDRDVWVGDGRRWRLTQTGRKAWCWTEMRDG